MSTATNPIGGLEPPTNPGPPVGKQPGPPIPCLNSFGEVNPSSDLPVTENE